MSKISPNGFKAVVDIDLLGTYNVTRAAFDAWLSEHGGSIVNISAPFQQKGVVFQSHVAAAKAGVDSLTRTCAVEWGPYGIRVNAIAPGSDWWNGRGSTICRGRERGRRSPQEPAWPARCGSDIAYLTLFLCSPMARFVSGQVIAVDGGGSADLLKMQAGRI